MGRHKYKIEDFFNNIFPEPNTGCFIWSGNVNSRGYGLAKLYNNAGEFVLRGAHRIAYFLDKGPFDFKLFICHKCDNPFCVNPDHLFLGTAKDNAIDCISKNRAYRGERNRKLVGKEVSEIRKRYATGLYTQAQLSKEYECSRQCIGQIVRLERWDATL